MEEDSSFSRGGEMSLLEQFEGILEGDKLIDEIGFLGASQFVSLDQDLSGSSLDQCTPIQSANVSLETNIAELNTVQYDKNFFWNRNNKLAISTDVLSHLYIAARHAYMDVSRRYKASINLTLNKGAFCSASAQANFDHLLEDEILKHTKALLILSCNFSSAWNDRKLVLSRKHEMPLFLEELRFSSLILSGAPKVEYAWSQRRWVIKIVGDYLQDLPGIIREESDLVEKIAEKSKMNYRAWGHRCWLISCMTSDQVFHELAKSKKWTELHVADNCCFHYRRELMLNLLKEYHEASTSCNFDVCLLYKEEFKWTELLIRRYIGREALWIHRRFLTQCWIKHFTTNQGAAVTESEDLISSTTQIFLAKELQFARSFLNIADGCYDTHDQAQYAASYILWTLKFALSQESMHEEILSELRDLKPLLLKTCAVNSLGWEMILL
ncbi:uncharacterized protein LOC141824485 isoform X2 [Curcuma longa]|uniref:uncharacterized protein LOC141824485 isoform X2 n=1 Tax=Curcuma longa TaxID=136217 RepID=UPI003D9DE8F6